MVMVAPRTPKRETCKCRIIALRSRLQGAAVEDLLAMTNWQPYTLRGCFSHQLRGWVTWRG